MNLKKGITVAFLLFVFFLPRTTLHAQSPNEELWQRFVTTVPGLPKIPQDDILKELVDPLNSATEWTKILTLCNRVFRGIYQGEISDKLFFPPVKVPLDFFFSEALKDGGKTASPRYGKPVSWKNRVDIPVRIVGTTPPVVGNIYLVQNTGIWQIEQWSLDLSTLPLSGLKKEEPKESSEEQIEEPNES